VSAFSVCVREGVALFGQLVGVEQVAKLAESVAQVLRGGLALDLAVQDAHGFLRGVLLVGGEGGGWSGRLGGREGNDVCCTSVCGLKSGERAVRGRCHEVKAGY